MIKITVEVALENVDTVLASLKENPHIKAVHVEDDVDQNLKPMTDIDFYKLINASNKDQREDKLISQKTLMEEVKTW